MSHMKGFSKDRANLGLCDSVVTGNIRMVSHFLKARGDPNVSTVSGHTPLTLALTASQIDVARVSVLTTLLVDAKAHVDLPIPAAFHINERTGVVLTVPKYSAHPDAHTPHYGNSDHASPVASDIFSSNRATETSPSSTSLYSFPDRVTPLFLAIYNEPQDGVYAYFAATEHLPSPIQVLLERGARGSGGLAWSEVASRCGGGGARTGTSGGTDPDYGTGMRAVLPQTHAGTGGYGELPLRQSLTTAATLATPTPTSTITDAIVLSDVPGGMSSLALACEMGHVNTVALLLRYHTPAAVGVEGGLLGRDGCPRESMTEQTGGRGVDGGGVGRVAQWTTLMTFAAHGRTDAIQTLLLAMGGAAFRHRAGSGGAAADGVTPTRDCRPLRNTAHRKPAVGIKGTSPAKASAMSAPTSTLCKRNGGVVAMGTCEHARRRACGEDRDYGSGKPHPTSPCGRGDCDGYMSGLEDDGEGASVEECVCSYSPLHAPASDDDDRDDGDCGYGDDGELVAGDAGCVEEEEGLVIPAMLSPTRLQSHAPVGGGPKGEGARVSAVERRHMDGEEEEEHEEGLVLSFVDSSDDDSDVPNDNYDCDKTTDDIARLYSRVHSRVQSVLAALTGKSGRARARTINIASNDIAVSDAPTFALTSASTVAAAAASDGTRALSQPLHRHVAVLSSSTSSAVAASRAGSSSKHAPNPSSFVSTHAGAPPHTPVAADSSAPACLYASLRPPRLRTHAPHPLSPLAALPSSLPLLSSPLATLPTLRVHLPPSPTPKHSPSSRLAHFSPPTPLSASPNASPIACQADAVGSPHAWRSTARVHTPAHAPIATPEVVFTSVATDTSMRTSTGRGAGANVRVCMAMGMGASSATCPAPHEWPLSPLGGAYTHYTRRSPHAPTSAPTHTPSYTPLQHANADHPHHYARDLHYQSHTPTLQLVASADNGISTDVAMGTGASTEEGARVGDGDSLSAVTASLQHPKHTLHTITSNSNNTTSITARSNAVPAEGMGVRVPSTLSLRRQTHIAPLVAGTAVGAPGRVRAYTDNTDV